MHRHYIRRRFWAVIGNFANKRWMASWKSGKPSTFWMNLGTHCVRKWQHHGGYANEDWYDSKTWFD